MPPPTNATEFLDLLERSSLLSPSQIQKAVERYRAQGRNDESASRLAEFLLEENLITRFHHDQLLSGRHRGFVVGRYKILKLIGSGGMGRVYLAEHSIMRRQVALKILPKTKSSDPSALGRFQREARAVAALNHPNIIQAYDIDQDGDLHYMVMEFIDGKSIQEYVKEFGPIPWPLAVDFACQSAVGLEHAHEAGLVHRDIKPGNLLIDSSGTIKILDMGLAVFFTEKDAESLTVTYNENVLGTADYLAPEQALDSHNVDIRADIYSLAGTFYFMLTGRPPFPEGTIAQKLLWHQSKEPRPLKEFVTELPDEVVSVHRRMMAKKPADRFTTPGEVVDALSAWAVPCDRPFDMDAVRGTLMTASSFKSTPGGSGSFRALNRSSSGSTPTRRRPSGRGTSEARPPSTHEPKTPTSGETRIDAKPPSDAKPPVDAGLPVETPPSLPWATAPSPDTDPVPAVDPSAEPPKPAVAATSDATAAGKPTDSSDAIADEASDFLSSLAGSSDKRTGSSLTSHANAASASAVRPDWARTIAIGLGAGAIIAAGVFFALYFTQVPAEQRSNPKQTKITKQPSPAEHKDRELVVGPDAPYRLIDEALYAANAGDTIVVNPHDGGWLQSTLRLSPQVINNVEGVTLRGKSPDVLVKTVNTLPILVIEQTPRFVVKDLTFDAGGREGPVIEIRGSNVHGVTLQNVTVRNFLGVGIRIVDAYGDREAIRLENVTVECSKFGNVGIAIGDGTAGSAPKGLSRIVEFVNCDIHGVNAPLPFVAGYKILQPIEKIAIRGGTLSKGQVGILLSAKDVDYHQLSVEGVRTDMLTQLIKSEVGTEAEKSVRVVGIQSAVPGSPAPPAKKQP